MSDVENDHVSVELWGGVIVNWARCVVFKLHYDKLTRGLCWVIAADAPA